MPGSVPGPAGTGRCRICPFLGSQGWILPASPADPRGLLVGSTGSSLRRGAGSSPAVGSGFVSKGLVEFWNLVCLLPLFPGVEGQGQAGEALVFTPCC